MEKSHESMNRWLRGEALAEQPGEENGLTSEQAQRIEKYMELGASYQEARSLVLGAVECGQQKVPEGNAGSGTGEHPKGRTDMNEWIRKAAGHSRW